MKKLFLMAIVVAGFGMSAMAQEKMDYSNSVNTNLLCSTDMSEDVNTYTVRVLSVTSTTVELLVEANNAVYDFCNYFDNSWVDVGLSVYCSFAGTGAYGECIVYKAVRLACGINGAIKLSMEGDIESAIKVALKSAGQVYTMSKISSNKYKLTEMMSKWN